MYIISTDGLCKGNKTGMPGTWAFAVFKDKELLGHKSGSNSSTTNNEMELYAILQALRWMDLFNIPSAEILTDSIYSKRCIEDWAKNWKENGWRTAKKAPVKNKEIVKELFELRNRLGDRVTLTWVKGHSGNLFNETADMYCNERFLDDFHD